MLSMGESLSQLESMSSVIKKHYPELQQSSEIERYVCEGCNQEVTVLQMITLLGPNKGKPFTSKRGCKCWEKEIAEQTLKERELSKIQMFSRRYNLVNPELLDKTLKNYVPQNETQEEALRIACDYVRNFDDGESMNLLFVGTYGLGKSHISHGICKAVEARRKSYIFTSIPKLVSLLKTSYNRSSDLSEYEIFKAFGEVDLLVLDDLGAEAQKRDREGNIIEDGWFQEKMFTILDSRNGKHTIFTTNLNSKELNLRVGARNYSRMFNKTKIVKIEGDDYRIKNTNF